MRCFSILISIFLTLSFSAFSQLSYQVDGKVDLAGAAFAYLYIPSSSQATIQVQKARIVNNRFVFSGSIGPSPEGYSLARIFFDSSAVDKSKLVAKQKSPASAFVEIVLDKALQISITRDTLLQSVAGSNLNEIYFQLKQLRLVKPATPEQQLNYYSAISAFLVKYPSTVFSKEAFEGLMKLPAGLTDKLIPDLSAVCSSVDSAWLTSLPARNMLTKLSKANAARKYALGYLLPDHVFYDGNDTVSIGQFRGKYLLLYFWASWSVPVRQYQSELEQAFLQYPGRNFSILQVSLDRNINTWKRFFEGRKVLWKQARLVKGWDAGVVSTFDIRGLPRTYLLDPSGKIIGQNLTSRQIIEFLRKLPG